MQRLKYVMQNMLNNVILAIPFSLLKYIAQSSSDIPSPHSFVSVPLQSVPWYMMSKDEKRAELKKMNENHNKMSFNELQAELKKRDENIKYNLETGVSVTKDGDKIEYAKTLDARLPYSQKCNNSYINELRRTYPTFFGSGNTIEDDFEDLNHLEHRLKITNL